MQYTIVMLAGIRLQMQVIAHSDHKQYCRGFKWLVEVGGGPCTDKKKRILHPPYWMSTARLCALLYHTYNNTRLQTQNAHAKY
jgi:hypothetical protein